MGTSLVLGADALSVAGQQKSGGGASPAQYVNNLTSTMNGILGNSLNQAIGTSTGYTNQAVDTQNASLAAANTMLTNAQQKAAGISSTGFNQAQALSSPYARAGANALDTLSGTLGLASPTMGSYNMAQAQAGLATSPIAAQLEALRSTGSAAGAGNIFSTPTNTAVAPNLQQSIAGVNPNAVSQYVNANTSGVGTSGWAGPQVQGITRGNQVIDPITGQAIGGYNPTNVNQATQSLLGQQAYNTANNQYQQQQGLFNNYNTAYSNLGSTLQGLSPQQQQVLASNPSLFAGK